MKQNVLQLIGSFHTGGSERQAVQLAKLLTEDGRFRIFIACLNPEGALRAEVEQFYTGKIAAFPLTSFYDQNFLQQIRRFREFLKENQISLVHSHDFYTNVFGAFAGKPARIASKRETGGMRSKPQRIIEKQVFRRADWIIANSEAVKNYLIAGGVSGDKISVVYNGLDLSKFKTEFDRQGILRSFGLPDKKLVTIVANLRHAVKNQEMFLRAAQKIKEKGENAAFVLAGEGERETELKKLANELKIERDVFFIGRADRVAELLAVSEVCVLASRAEGFSNAILEYQAASRPVVATAVGGAAEVIFNGENGFLVESDDDRKMAEKILFLLENPEIAKQFGERGREIVETGFSLKAQLENTIAVYNQVFRGK
ncbi:MAG: glycosyltransferase family 4 protein [Acidobacteriota bacterium]|nr:glycosyltransferase family 4 protein [Acidobacteriota bacterium]